MADTTWEALRAENAKLKTVMIAAAEEIHRHWDAHCDAEGYGPANLMRRLEEGIPSEYGYTAGAFESLKARELEMAELLRSACAIAERHGAATAWGRFVASVHKLGLTGVTARTYRVLPDEEESGSTTGDEG